MLKLGTVFSGIGSIEHSLERLGIEFQVSFACDNGGVDIFSKKIDKNLISIYDEIEILQTRISSINQNHFEDANELNLNDHMNHILDIYDEVLRLSEVIAGNIVKDKTLNNILNSYIEKSEEFKNKTKFVKFINHNEDNQLTEQRKHSYYILKEIKDYYNNKNFRESFVNVFEKKFEEFEHSFKALTNGKEVKALNGSLSEIIESINMFVERLSTVEVLDDLSKIHDYRDKKAYVDNLYNKKQSSNFVYKSYKANYNIEDENFHWNASFLDGRQYRNNIDLFVGGSPCQSFSMVGKRRGLQDTRGTLFYEYARLVEEIQPKVFIYENVKGLLNHDGGNTWETMQQVFHDLNYDWNYKILNSKDYGIPQNRERIFVVGFRKDLVLDKKFAFPKPIPLNKKMQDYLLDNVSGKYYLQKKGVEFVTSERNIQKRYTQIDGDIQLCQKANQQFNWHGDFVFVEESKSKEKMMEDLEKYFLSEKVEKYVMSSGTKNFYSKPKIDLEIARPLLTTMHKMHRAGVDNYVTTEGRIRKLTPRECLRLMGFCDSFKIVVSDTQMYQQAGNSIVVDVLMEVMKSIVNTLPQIVEGENYIYNNELVPML